MNILFYVWNQIISSKKDYNMDIRANGKLPKMTHTDQLIILGARLWTAEMICALNHQAGTHISENIRATFQTYNSWITWPHSKSKWLG